MTTMTASALNDMIDAAVEKGTGSPIDNVKSKLGDVVVFDKNNELVGAELMTACKFITSNDAATIDLATGHLSVASDVVSMMYEMGSSFNWIRRVPTDADGWRSSNGAVACKKSMTPWPSLYDDNLPYDWTITVVLRIGQNGILLGTCTDLTDPVTHRQLTLVRQPGKMYVEHWNNKSSHVAIFTKDITEPAGSYCKVKVTRHRREFKFETTKSVASVDTAKAAAFTDTATFTLPSSLPNDLIWSTTAGYWGASDWLYPLTKPLPYGLVISIEHNLVCKYDVVSGTWDNSLTLADLQRGIFYRDSVSKEMYYLTFDGIMEKIR